MVNMANDGYITRDGAEEDLQEHPGWTWVLVILMSLLLLFLTITFEHDFI